MEIVFLRPIYLWFLLSVILLVAIHFYSLKHLRRRAIKFANFEAIERVTGREVFSKNIFLLFIRVLALVCAIFALAGTTLWYFGQSSDSNFVLAIDTSASMSADDFSPNRLEVAKKEAINFVDYVGQSRIGLVVFSGVSFVEPELMESGERIKELIREVQIDRTYGGTNLGSAITNGVNLLLSEDSSRTVILLTDGRSNVGSLDDAIEYSLKNHVLIHIIGVGTVEGGKFAGDAISKIDQENLALISSATGGNFFMVENQESMAKAYREIASLSDRQISFNLSPLLMLIALGILFFEWILANTKYRTLP